MELKNLRKDFGGLRAVDDVSLQAPEGAIIGLIGPNGSGKSTLINLIAGSQELTAGRIIFAGEDISDLAPDAVYNSGIARGYQEPSLYFKMTVLDNVLLPVKAQRGENPGTRPAGAAGSAKRRRKPSAPSRCSSRCSSCGITTRWRPTCPAGR